MKKSNIVKPVGLKGNDKLNRMRELMGQAPINEGIKRSVVELTKEGPDGNIYAIVRENHEYFIKVSENKSNLVTEDFQYMGGLQNKKDKVYPSYAKAIKQLNLKFMSINESIGKSGSFNTFSDDGLLTEHDGMNPNAKLSAEKGVGDADEYVVDKKGEKLDYDASEGTEDGEFGDNLANGKADKDFKKAKVEMNETEKAIDEMIEGEEGCVCEGVCECGKGVVEESKKGFSISRAIQEMDSIIDSISGEDEKIDAILESLGEDERAIMMEALKKRVTESIPTINGNLALANIVQQKAESDAVVEMRFDGKKPIEFTDETVALEEKNLEEETKYKLKLDAPESEPAFGGSDDAGLDSFEDAGDDFGGDDEGFSDDGDKPFDDEPFDAGVEADEDEDPEKYIQQLAGKLGTSLRKYNDERGEPDFDLEKYAINSVISASHTSEMDEEDQKDIIKKVKMSGAESDVDDSAEELDIEPEGEEEGEPEGEEELGFGEEELDEGFDFSETPESESFENFDDAYDAAEKAWLDKQILKFKNKAIKLSVLINDISEKAGEVYFNMDGEDCELDGIEISDDEIVINFWGDNGDDSLTYDLNDKNTYETSSFNNSIIKVLNKIKLAAKKKVSSILGEGDNPCWDGYEQVGMKEKGGKEVPNCVPKDSVNEGEFGSKNYMFWQNLTTMKDSIESLMSMDKNKVDALLDNGHGWALDHIATSADDVEEVYHFVTARGSNEGGAINEAEYKGKKVELNKPTSGDVAKFKVFVKNDKGNVIKVNFGDKNMEIRRDNDEARKSFRARHKCSEKKDKTTPGYWSCKMWSNKKVSDIVSEGLNKSEKSSTFEESSTMKDIITAKLHETTEPIVKPKVDPAVKPGIKESPRRRKVWETKPIVKPKPKMIINGKEVDESSLEVEGCESRDYPEWADAYFSFGMFVDGTEMSEDDLDQLGYDYHGLLSDMCYQSFIR